MDERMRMRRIPRGEPDNENSYRCFSLCQAGAMGELGGRRKFHNGGFLCCLEERGLAREKCKGGLGM